MNYDPNCECEGDGWGPTYHVSTCYLSRFNSNNKTERKSKMAPKQTKIIKVNPARHIVVTPLARASFPNLFTAKGIPGKPDSKPQFKIDLLFDPADIKKPGKGKKGATPSLHEAYYNAIKDQWGSDKTKWPKMRYGYADVFKNGDEQRQKDEDGNPGETYQGYEGKIVVSAKSIEKFPPKVFDRYGEPLTESDMYGGCFVQALLVARPYNFAGNLGVSFKLSQVIKMKDGERFGGGIHEMAFAIEEEGGEMLGDDEHGSSEDDGSGDDW